METAAGIIGSGNIGGGCGGGATTCSAVAIGTGAIGGGVMGRLVCLRRIASSLSRFCSTSISANKAFYERNLKFKQTFNQLLAFIKLALDNAE